MTRKYPGQLPAAQYIDRPEISEVYADGLSRLLFDGTCIRMEFVVTRFDEPQEGDPPRQWAYTSARVVMSRMGAVEFMNKVRQLERVLIATGVITPNPTPPPEGGAPGAEQKPQTARP